MKRRFTQLLASGALAFALLGATDALAQQRPTPPPPAAPAAPVTGPVNVEILTVRATNSNDRVDPELRPIIKQLSYTRFTGFDLIDTHTRALTVGSTTSIAIEGGRRLKIDLVDRDEVSSRVRLSLFDPEGDKMLDTTVAVHRNRTFMVAGPKIGEDVLIIPVTVRY